jgi:hypothetical protein
MGLEGLSVEKVSLAMVAGMRAVMAPPSEQCGKVIGQGKARAMAEIAQ